MKHPTIHDLLKKRWFRVCVMLCELPSFTLTHSELLTLTICSRHATTRTRGWGKSVVQGRACTGRSTENFVLLVQLLTYKACFVRVSGTGGWIRNNPWGGLCYSRRKRPTDAFSGRNCQNVCVISSSLALGISTPNNLADVTRFDLPDCCSRVQKTGVVEPVPEKCFRFWCLWRSESECL